MFVSTTRTSRTWCLDRQTRFLQSLQGGFALFGRCCCCCYCWTWFLQSLQGGFPSLILVVDKPPCLTKVPDYTICQIRYKKKQIVRRWRCLSCCYCCRRVACVVYHFIGPRVRLAGLKVMMLMGMVVVKMISFVFCQSQVQVEVPRSRTGRVGEWKEQPSFYGRGWDSSRISSSLSSSQSSSSSSSS